MMTIIGSSVNLLFCISRFRELLKKIGPCVNSRKIAANQKPKIAVAPMNTGFMRLRNSACGSECRAFESHRAPNKKEIPASRRLQGFSILTFYNATEHHSCPPSSRLLHEC